MGLRVGVLCYRELYRHYDCLQVEKDSQSPLEDGKGDHINLDD